MSTRPNTAHDILRANLPLYPICGRVKSDHQRMAATMAILLPYLQLSSKARVKGRAYYRLTSIPLDIDGRHWHAHDFRDRDIPVPDVIIRNPDKPSTHAVWVLPFPVWMPVGAKARPFATDRQPWELYLAVEAWLVAATGADRPLRALKVKNPWSTEHDVEWTHNGHVRGLDELIQWVPATKPEQVQEDSGEGRNATLFRRALLAVTGIARRVGQAVDDLTDALYQVGDVLNVFPEPLPVGEVRSTLRSVARYASQWTIRAEATKGWVVSKGLEPEEIRLRQSASAARTNGMRRDKTLAELTRVARLMVADGVEVTKAGLARASGVARVTVQRAWDRLSTALLNTGPSTGRGCEVVTMEQVGGATVGESAPVEAAQLPAQCPVSKGLKDPASGSDLKSENFVAETHTERCKMHERARLEQLGTLKIRTLAYIWAKVDGIDDTNAHGKGRSVESAILDLYDRLTGTPFIAQVGDVTVAAWWDPRIQDWGTSPNAPDGWPAPAKDPDDIRARLDSVLEGIGVEYWHGRDYPSDDVHWTATAGEHTGYGVTEGEAYLDIWHDLKRKH